MGSSSSLPDNVRPLFPKSGSEAFIEEIENVVEKPEEVTNFFISDSSSITLTEALFDNKEYQFYIDDDTLTAEAGEIELKEQSMTDSSNDKYIDERFKRVEERLDHKVEMVSIKIDALSDKISDNTEWMKKLVDKSTEDIKRIEDDGKETRSEILSDGRTTRTAIVTTVIGAFFALFIGFACILYMINQMQNSWLQTYLNITNKPSISQPINSQTTTQNSALTKPTNNQQPQISNP